MDKQQRLGEIDGILRYQGPGLIRDALLIERMTLPTSKPIPPMPKSESYTAGMTFTWKAQCDTHVMRGASKCIEAGDALIQAGQEILEQEGMREEPYDSVTITLTRIRK